MATLINHLEYARCTTILRMVFRVRGERLVFNFEIFTDNSNKVCPGIRYKYSRAVIFSLPHIALPYWLVPEKFTRMLQSPSCDTRSITRSAQSPEHACPLVPTLPLFASLLDRKSRGRFSVWKVVGETIIIIIGNLWCICLYDGIIRISRE